MNNPEKLSPWVRFKRGAIIVCTYEPRHGGWAFTVGRWGKADRARWRNRGCPAHPGRLPTWVNLASGGPYSLGMDSAQTLGEALAAAEAMLRQTRARRLV